jgi:nicotinamide riboside transporter PnuC
VSQDLVSVIAAVAVLLCIVLVRRGRESAWLVWVAMLGYLFYAYALYCFEGVYNPLYLFYIAIVGLVVYSVIGFFRRADFGALKVKSEHKLPPRRSVAVLCLVLAVMFAALWFSMLIPAMSTRVRPEAGTIFVLDLSFFLPLLVFEAFLLFRKQPLGDVLAVPILIKIGTLGVSVLVGTLLAPWFGGEVDVASVGIYAILGLGPLAFAVPYLSALRVGGS